MEWKVGKLWNIRNLQRHKKYLMLTESLCEINVFISTKRGLRGYFIIVSKYLHREKVQDIKELFNLTTNNTMGTKDVSIQADKMKLLIRHISFWHAGWLSTKAKHEGEGRFPISPCQQSQTERFCGKSQSMGESCGLKIKITLYDLP